MTQCRRSLVPSGTFFFTVALATALRTKRTATQNVGREQEAGQVLQSRMLECKTSPRTLHDIDIEQVVEDLKDYGVVVLVATRTHAKEVAAEAFVKLGINRDDEEGPHLQHLSLKWMIEGGATV